MTRKILSLLLSLCLMLSLASFSFAEGAFTPGEYEATSQGFGGAVAVKLTVDGEKVDCTLKEYEILAYLMQNRNIALSRDRMLQDIWGYDFFGDDRTIDTHIKNLRIRLGA